MNEMKSIVRIFFILFFLCISVNGNSGMREKSNVLVEKSNGQVVEGKDGWLYLKEELIHMGSGKFWGEKAAEVSRVSNRKLADPVPAIIDFNNQLKELGIQMLLVPIPPKAALYPEYLPEEGGDSEMGELVKLHQVFYNLLREQGVNVVDVWPIFDEYRKKEQLYCKTDTHTSGKGLRLISEVIAKKVKAAAWYKDLEKEEFNADLHKVSIHGDLAQMLGKDDREEIELQKVSGTKDIITSHSPVLLLGDSHTLVFSAGGDLHAKKSGLAEQLAKELGIGIDVIGVRGSGATPARIKLFQKGKKNNQYIHDKKVVVWCFTVREFTGSGGWRIVPVVKRQKK